MDFLAGPAPDNYDEVRDRNLSTNRKISRDSSMSSAMFSVAYHERMESNNNMVINDKRVDSSPVLSHKTEQEKALHVNKAAEQQVNIRPKCDNLIASNSNPKCVFNKEQQPNTTCGSTSQTGDDNIINIQLPYDPQVPTELDL